MSDSSSRREFLAGSLALQAPQRQASVPLRYRTLGKTGLKVTEVGCGCEAVSDVSVLQRALDLGVNFFDTARPYQGGNNERVLRAALGVGRKEVIVASRSYGKDARTIQRELDESLYELRTDYLDIWYLGSKDSPDSVSDDMLEVQRKAQQAGKLRFRGLSTHRLPGMRDFILQRGRFDVIQVSYSFATGAGAEGAAIEAALDEMKKVGVGMVAMKVMGGGYLRRLTDSLRRSLTERPSAHVAALRWALRHDRIQTTSVRMADREQLEENIRAMEKPFSEEDRKLLAVRLDEIRPLLCRMCGACDGACPKGMPVSELVRCATYAEGYGVYAMGRDRFSRLPAVAREVRCSDCARCAVRCPNGVRLHERLVRAQELYC